MLPRHIHARQFVRHECELARDIATLLDCFLHIQQEQSALVTKRTPSVSYAPGISVMSRLRSFFTTARSCDGPRLRPSLSLPP